MNQPDWDKLIGDALHQEAPAEPLRRLEFFWQRQLAADRRHRRAATTALAASIGLLTCGAGWLIWQSPSFELVQSQQTVASTNGSVPRPPVDNATPSVPSARPVDSSAGRPATAYELAMFRLSIVRAERTQAAAEVQNIAESVVQLEQHVGLRGLPPTALAAADPRLCLAIARRLLTANDHEALRGYLALVASEQSRVEALAAAREVEQPPVDALLALLSDGEKPVRRSAAIVLGWLNGPKVTRSLIDMVMEDQHAPAEAWIALLACRGEPAEQFLAAAAHHPRMLGRLNNARLFWQTLQ